MFARLGSAVSFVSRNQTAAFLIVFGAWVFERPLEALLGTAAYLPYSLIGAFVQDELLAGAALTVIAAAAVPAAAST